MKNRSHTSEHFISKENLIVAPNPPDLTPLKKTTFTMMCLAFSILENFCEFVFFNN